MRVYVIAKKCASIYVCVGVCTVVCLSVDRASFLLKKLYIFHFQCLCEEREEKNNNHANKQRNTQ